MKKLSKSKIRHSSSWNASMFETECLLLKPRLMKMSKGEVPLDHDLF